MTITELVKERYDNFLKTSGFSDKAAIGVAKGIISDYEGAISFIDDMKDFVKYAEKTSSMYMEEKVVREDTQTNTPIIPQEDVEKAMANNYLIVDQDVPDNLAFFKTIERVIEYLNEAAKEIRDPTDSFAIDEFYKAVKVYNVHTGEKVSYRLEADVSYTVSILD